MSRLIGTIVFLILLWILLSNCGSSVDPLIQKDHQIDSLQKELLFKTAEVAKFKVDLAACKTLNDDTEGKYAETSKFKKSDCVLIWSKWKGVINGAYYSKEDNKTIYYRVNVLLPDDTFEIDYYYETELERGECK